MAQSLSQNQSTKILKLSNASNSFQLPIISDCNSFNRTEFPGLMDLSSRLPVFPGAVLTVNCENPTRYAIISGDKTLTCVESE